MPCAGEGTGRGRGVTSRRARTPPRGADGPRAARAALPLREIDALNAVDRGAVFSGLIALRTATPAALAALSMPVLCIAGAEDVVIRRTRSPSWWSALAHALARRRPDTRSGRART
jgi:pimeloyl-ACP methyl ester carboxylesterase